jgi:hypothetical protein
MAKGFKSGGRKPGTPNRVSAQAIARAVRRGVTPLDFLLSVMRNHRWPIMLRVDAAGKAAQYVHPKLAMIEHSGAVTHKHVSEFTIPELDARITELTAGETQAAAGTAETSGLH